MEKSFAGSIPADGAKFIERRHALLTSGMQTCLPSPKGESVVAVTPQAQHDPDAKRKVLAALN